MATADSPISDPVSTVARPDQSPMSVAQVTSAAVMGKAEPHTSLSLVHNAPPTLTDATTSSALLGSTDSAQSFLRDVHNEAESERGSGSRRSMFWRSRSSVSSKETKLVGSRGATNSSQGSGNGRNGRQGSVGSKEMRTTQGLVGSRTQGSVSGPRGSVSGPRGSVSGSINSKHYAKMGLVMDSLPKQSTTSARVGPSASVEVSESVVYEGGYEVVGLEGDVRASPPISMQSESLGSGGEGPASSPDSGYGNTPDNPDHLAKVRTSSLGHGRGRSGAISGCGRAREGTQDSAFSMEPSPMEDPPLTPHPPTGPGAGHGATPTNAGLSQHSALVTQSLLDPREVNGYKHHVRRSPQTIDSHHTYLKKRRGQSATRGQSISRPFSKSTEMLRSSKSFSAHSPPRDEKDYFQVTDELSQENAHLSMSDALLAVIEHYKATYLEQTLLQDQVPSSPHLNSSLPGNSSLLSRSPSTPGESAFLSSWGSMSSVATLDDSMDGRGSHSTTRVSLLQLMQSQSCDHSAESTAQKLLQHMASHMSGNMKDISKLSIKLPTEFLISLQNDEDLQRSVTTSSAHIRGSKEWAPPRKQFIYHIKEASKNMQVELAAQGHRCTGCGMKVDSTHSKHFRFCNYVGKYFCQNCHTNATHVIPAQILERWAFKRLPVSNFARDLLTKFFDDAVFSVHPEHKVYSRVFVMSKAKEVRTELVEIRQYLRTCRRASRLYEVFDSMSPWTTDIISFSISDFQELRLGTKLKQLKTLLAEAVNHVKTCQVCQGKGFVCEFCKNNDDIIFPFEATKVSKCACCNNCFHKHCFAGSAQCPRCERIKERQKQRVSKIVLEAEEEDDGMEEPSFVDSPG